MWCRRPRRLKTGSTWAKTKWSRVTFGQLHFSPPLDPILGPKGLLATFWGAQNRSPWDQDTCWSIPSALHSLLEKCNSHHFLTLFQYGNGPFQGLFGFSGGQTGSPQLKAG